MRNRCVLLLAGLMCCMGSANAALMFNFTKDASTSQADYDMVLPAFTQAGQMWSSLLADNITVNLTIGYRALDTGVLGEASSTTQGYAYTNVRAALIADAKSATDAIAVANLPAGSSLAHFRNNRAGTKYLDNDGSANNTTLDINTANAKALGLSVSNPAASDGFIVFSNLYAWDFDRSNGISPGTFDLVGVAAHEIGHTLGFTSGVDVIDLYTGNGPLANEDLNGPPPGIGELDPYRIYGVLDLYRKSSAAVAAGSGVLDLATGGTPYFSIDGGATNLALFSTGDYNGDGWQASHWKDNLGLGIMDPTAAFGELLMISSLDLLAFDVIGYDMIPEPGALAVLALGGLLLLRRRAA